MLPDDAAAGLAVGAGSALAKEALQQVKDLASRHLSKDLQLVGDTASVKDVREIRGSADRERYEAIVKNKDHRRWLRMGLLLRKAINDEGRRQALKDNLVRNGGRAAAHIAQCSQFDLLSHLTTALGAHVEDAVIGQILIDILDHIETRVTYVQAADKPEQTASDISLRLQAHNPDVYVMAAAGGAVHAARQIVARLRGAHPNHPMGRWDDDHQLVVLFINRALLD